MPSREARDWWRERALGRMRKARTRVWCREFSRAMRDIPHPNLIHFAAFVAGISVIVVTRAVLKG